jgi:hypothetical protein
MSFLDHVTQIKPTDAFSQNKVYTKNVNHIEYINTIIQNTTTYYIYKSAYINTMLLLFKVAPLTLYRCSYSGLDILGHSRKHPHLPTPFGCPNTITIIRNNLLSPPPPDGRNFLCGGSVDLFWNDPLC